MLEPSWKDAPCNPEMCRGPVKKRPWVQALLYNVSSSAERRGEEGDLQLAQAEGG